MRVHDLGEGKNPMHKINKFLDDKEKRAEYARELQQKRDAEDKDEIKEDLSSLPPLADLIVMAVIGQTTVAALKAAYKTGKYALKLKKLADKAGVKLNNAVMGESNPFTDARMNAIKAGKKEFTVNGKKYQVTGDTSDEEEAIANEAINRDEYAAKLAAQSQDKFMSAALAALDRLVKSDPRGQTVGGYAFDIARAFGGVNARELEKIYSQQVQEDNDPCWKGYRQLGMKKKGGKEVPNCIPEDVTEITLDEAEEIFGELVEDENLTEAEYQGRTVKLNKPMRGDVKKFKVYVKNEKGNVVKVNFGDPDMRIKKSNPARRKSFRARHNCDNPGPKTKARYWSCRKW